MRKGRLFSMFLLKYSLTVLWEAAPRHTLDSAKLPLFVNMCSLKSDFFVTLATV